MKITKLALYSLALIGIVCVSIPLSYSLIETSQPKEILITCEQYVYSGETITLEPTLIDENDKIKFDSTFTYQSASPLVTFSKEKNNQFTVSTEANDDDAFTITIASEGIKKDVAFIVKNGVYELIDVSTDNSLENFAFNNEYRLNIKGYPTFSFDDVTFSLQSGEEVSSYLEINQDFSFKCVGYGNDILLIKSKLNQDSIVSLPFNIIFLEPSLNYLFNEEKLTNKEIQSIETLDINVVSDTLLFDDLKAFSSLDSINLLNDEVINFNEGESINFDITVEETLFEEYEIRYEDSYIENIYPYSNKDHTVIYNYLENGENVREIQYADDDDPILNKVIYGYDFVSWKDTNDKIYTSINQLPKRVRLYGEYLAKKVTISFDYESESYDSLTYDFGDSINVDLPSPSQDGYVFLGWYDQNGNYYSKGTVILTDQDIILSPKFSQDFLINFDSKGGSSLEPLEVKYSSQIVGLEDKIPYRSNSSFIGWYYEDNLVSEGDIYSYLYSITLEARYEGSYSKVDDFNNYQNTINADTSISTINVDNEYSSSNITISNNCDELILTSTSEKTISNKIDILSRSEPLRIVLDNVHLVSTSYLINGSEASEVTLILKNNSSLQGKGANAITFNNLTIINEDDKHATITLTDIEYDSLDGYIKGDTLNLEGMITIDGSKETVFETPVPTIDVSNLIINSRSDIIVYGPNQLTRENVYSEGYDGGIGIKADSLVISELSLLTVKGGNGATPPNNIFASDNQGTSGTAGSDGSSAGKGGTGYNGTDGGLGQNGYKGGDSGIGVLVKKLTLNSQTTLNVLSSKAGNGSQGGVGGNGGNGGKGGNGGSTSTWFKAGGNGGLGGNGGNGGIGGTGGDGGDALINLSFEELTVDGNSNINVYENIPGQGGKGGTGGTGGSGGNGGKGGSSGFLGSSSKDGSGGNGGNGGDGGVGGYFGNPVSPIASIDYSLYSNLTLTIYYYEFNVIMDYGDAGSKGLGGEAGGNKGGAIKGNDGIDGISEEDLPSIITLKNHYETNYNYDNIHVIKAS